MTVSVITPIYGTPMKFWEECLESISQVLESDVSDQICDWQIVIDGDNRNIEQSVEALGSKKIQTIRLNRNVGLSAARNFGVRNCAGQFISWLDSDDTLEPTSFLAFLDEAVRRLTVDPRCAMIVSDNYQCDVDMAIIYSRPKGPIVAAHREFFRTTADPLLYFDIMYPSQLVRKQDILCVGGFREGAIGEDVKLLHELLELNTEAYVDHVDVSPYYYRYNAQGIVGTQSTLLRRINLADFQDFQNNRNVEFASLSTHRSFCFVTSDLAVECDPDIHEPQLTFNVYLPPAYSSFNLKTGKAE
jgi:glycosyltransferase involved in cell wall biosynthesis